MERFISVCRLMVGCSTHFLPRRVAQEPEELLEECEEKRPEKRQRGEREEEGMKMRPKHKVR